MCTSVLQEYATLVITLCNTASKFLDIELICLSLIYQDSDIKLDKRG